MLNVVVLQGRLTDHPELKQTNGGLDICRFTIATDSGYGENKKTSFVGCTAWRKTAEFISHYFKKGDMIGVVGMLYQNKYTTKDGESRSTLEVTVTEASFMGSPKKEEPAEEQKPLYTESNAPKFEDINPDDGDLPF